MNNNCPICFEYFYDNDVSITKCNHKFHTSCLLKMKDVKCPLCREIVINESKNNILDNLYILESNKCIGKKIDDRTIVYDDCYDIEYRSYRLNKLLRENIDNISDKDQLEEFIKKYDYNINSTGVAFYNDIIVGKIKKTNGKYIIDISNTTINIEKQNQRYLDETNMLIDEIEKHGLDDMMKFKINKLILKCSKSEKMLKKYITC